MWTCFRALVVLFFWALAKVQENLDNNNAASLFERLFHLVGVVKVTLLEQHRMPACIASFPNKQYYHGKLVTPPHAPSSLPRGFRWPSSDAICFIDEYGPGEKKDTNSLYNEREAQAIVDAIHWLLQSGDVVSDDVVILAFYHRQVQEICRRLWHCGTAKCA